MNRAQYSAIAIGGVIFGFGLALSGAAQPEVILSFLRLEDLGLVLVIGGALVVTLVTYQLAPRLSSKPLLGGVFEEAKRVAVSHWHILGAVVFGVGWGLSGICPGTAFAAVGSGNVPVIAGLVGIFLGAYFYGMLRTRGLPGLE